MVITRTRLAVGALLTAAIVVFGGAGATPRSQVAGAEETLPGRRPALPSTLLASYYGPGFEGQLTASGEVFDSHELTAASRTLPFGTRLLVRYRDRIVVVRVNDRGPYVDGRDLDLSEGAAAALGTHEVGVARVEVVILP
jgi:rare lipoprotein A